MTKIGAAGGGGGEGSIVAPAVGPGFLMERIVAAPQHRQQLGGQA
jgi:hypothetical protein